MDELISALTFAAAIGCGLVGGVFFAFSTFVMMGLRRLPPAEGIAAMQSINIAVINPTVMGTLFGTGAACLFLGVSSLLTQRPNTAFLLAGGASYLIGTIAVTIACNVPRNEALAAVDPESAEGARRWADYVARWTAWNHVRTAASLAASAAFIAALA